MRRALIAVALIAGVAVLLASAGAALVWRNLNMPLNVPPDGLVIDVEPGTAFRRLAAQLADSDVLTGPGLFAAYAGWTGDAKRIQAGEYRVTAGMTPLELLEKLARGEVVLHPFTIVEGQRFADALMNLRASPAVVATGLTGDEIMSALGSEGTNPEGQFLPDTYLFPKGTPELEVLRQAHAALESVLDREWAMRSDDVAVMTPYEALILASIIEKETALPAERALISGVFQERLRIGMRLQTDPTVIYGLGDSFDGNLRRRDLDSDNPYNTYTRRGLPPTPISLPGAAAIEAAVRPEMTGALYFVATGDPDGSHKFSRTIEEHNAAVRDYLRRQKDR